MNNQAGFATSTRLQAAFNKPLPQRCAEIRTLLQDTSLKEIHQIFPVLVEAIFASQSGWGLEKLSRSQHESFRAVRELLKSGGPLLTTIDKLCQDPHFKYEFPITCLPLRTQTCLEEGVVPALYTDKIQVSQSGRPFLFTNAFEYFIFQFAYFLVNTQNVKSIVWTNPNDVLYLILAEDYLNAFLPLDQNRPVKTEVRPTSPSQKPSSSPVWSPNHSSYQAPHLHSNALSAHPASSPFSGLHSTVESLHHTNVCSPVPATYPAGYQGTDSDIDLAKAQVFLQILLEFWLNAMSPESSSSPFSSVLESSLPSPDHVRCVRMLIKHLHYFCNTAPPEKPVTPFTSLPAPPLDVFKRQIISQHLQKPLYHFLKDAFHKWPLDTSFRQVLETWLSYIQPWRYTDHTQINRERTDDSRTVAVEEKWRGFVTENLLFYTSLLRAFLRRGLRMDLTSPRLTYMLFRVTKVFSVLGLRDMIEQAESSLYDGTSILQHTTMNPDLHASYSNVSMATVHSHAGHLHGNTGALIARQITELESPSHQYIPLFSEETCSVVSQLLSLISQARLSASSMAEKTSDSSWLSFLGFGPPQDYNTSRYHTGDRPDDLTQSDLHKLQSHLDQSAANLSAFFQINTRDRPDKTVSWGRTESGVGVVNTDEPRRPDTLTPDTYQTEDGPKLSPLGRYQLMNGLKKFEISYHGDPELQPIRSYESVVLVRMLYAVSNFINQQFGSYFEQYYYRDNLAGQLARQLLWKPTSMSERSSPVSERSRYPRRQHPWLSLRWLGNTHTLTWLSMVYICLWLFFDTGPVTFVLLCVLSVFLMALCRVYTNPVNLRAL